MVIVTIVSLRCLLLPTAPPPLSIFSTLPILHTTNPLSLCQLMHTGLHCSEVGACHGSEHSTESTDMHVRASQAAQGGGGREGEKREKKQRRVNGEYVESGRQDSGVPHIHTFRAAYSCKCMHEYIKNRFWAKRKKKSEKTSHGHESTPHPHTPTCTCKFQPALNIDFAQPW